MRINCPFRRVLESNKGYTMAFTAGVVVILLILGVAIWVLVENEVTMITQYKKSTNAYWLAEAGINRALWNIDAGRRSEATIGSESSPVSLGDGSYYTVYDTNSKLLTSVGMDGGVTKTITVRVNDEVVASAFDTAVFAAQFTSIPAEVTIWNDCTIADPDPTKVVAVHYGVSALTINGWVKNKPYSGLDDLGWAYAASGNITPASLKNKQWKQATEDPGYEWVVFDRSDYQSAIVAADQNDNESADGSYVCNSDVTLTPGTDYPEFGATWDATNSRWLIDGDLTIQGCILTTDGSFTSSSAAEIIVYGTLTIQDATIGTSSADNYIHITVGGAEDYQPTQPDPNDYSGSKPKLNSSTPTMRIEGTDPSNNKRVYIYKEVRLYSNGKTEIYNAVEMSQASIYSLGEIHLTSNQPGVKLNLGGDVFSKDGVRFTTTGTGVGVVVEGSCIAGCKSPDPDSPGDLLTYSGQIFFSETNKEIDLIFNRGAKADSGPGGAFQVSAGATLDYSTWREK